MQFTWTWVQNSQEEMENISNNIEYMYTGCPKVTQNSIFGTPYIHIYDLYSWRISPLLMIFSPKNRILWGDNSRTEEVSCSENCDTCCSMADKHYCLKHKFLYFPSKTIYEGILSQFFRPFTCLGCFSWLSQISEAFLGHPVVYFCRK